MSPTLIAQAVALASAAGVSVYGTVAMLGLATRFGWIDALPPALAGLSAWWVIGLAATLYAVEFLATLVPGVATAWETVHTAVRPLAGAALAAGTAWQGEASFTLLAALLGGTLALGTQVTKLGARATIDASPEPFTNGAANVAELGFVASIALLVWEHPWVALAIALISLVVVALLVRAAWRSLRSLFGRRTRSS
jgi:hypothetical protein